MRLFILVVSIVLFPICSSAQCSKLESILRHPFKIKAVRGVSSATAREGDYVEFQTMESIYSKNGEELFPKETPIYGRVTLRRHRHFPLVSGKLEVVLEPLLTWNGQPVEIGIARSGKMKAALGSNRNVNRACGDPGSDCVAGRRNANVAAAVPAIAGAGTAAVASAVNDTNTKFIIVSSFFSVAKDVAELLNGTDAAIEAGEIFDLHVSAETTVCPVPKPPHDGQMPGKK